MAKKRRKKVTEKLTTVPPEYADKSPEWINGYLQGQVDLDKKFVAYLDGLIVPTACAKVNLRNAPKAPKPVEPK